MGELKALGKLKLQIAVWVFRIISTVMLLVVMIGMALALWSPNTLEAIRRFIWELRRMPDWGAWLGLVGALVIILILWAPVIIQRLKQREDA